MRTTIWNVVVLAVAALVLTATALPAQGGGGGDKYKCRVKNLTTRRNSPRLQAQINAAGPGDTLEIQGVCVGSFTIWPGMELTLLGVEEFGIEPTLDGNGSGTVLYIDGYTDLTFVTLTDLTITGGLADYGGGIFNLFGDLTLSGSTIVAWNAAIYGGGIYNEYGNVHLEDSAEVSWNDAGTGGGGIYSANGTLGLRDEAKVRWNDAHSGGGIKSHGPLAQVTMYGWSQVSENTAYQYAGICNAGEANLQLDQWSQVVGNEAESHGGGIFNDPGSTATMWADSTVTRNIADAVNNGYGEGGGIYGCVEGAVDGVNVDDNHLVSMSGPVDNIANGCD